MYYWSPLYYQTGSGLPARGRGCHAWYYEKCILETKITYYICWEGNFENWFTKSARCSCWRKLKVLIKAESSGKSSWDIQHKSTHKKESHWKKVLLWNKKLRRKNVEIRLSAGNIFIKDYDSCTRLFCFRYIFIYTGICTIRYSVGEIWRYLWHHQIEDNGPVEFVIDNVSDKFLDFSIIRFWK